MTLTNNLHVHCAAVSCFSDSTLRIVKRSVWAVTSFVRMVTFSASQEQLYQTANTTTNKGQWTIGEQGST